MNKSIKEEGVLVLKILKAKITNKPKLYIQKLQQQLDDLKKTKKQ